jgi:hypothetical protein
MFIWEMGSYLMMLSIPRLQGVKKSIQGSFTHNSCKKRDHQVDQDMVLPSGYHIFWVAVGLKRGPLSPCEDKWGATWKESSGSGLENWD